MSPEARVKDRAPHASVVGSELEGTLVVMHSVERHLQQLICLSQTIPRPVVILIQGGRPSVCIYTTNTSACQSKMGINALQSEQLSALVSS